jgi:hypothetical protein
MLMSLALNGLESDKVTHSHNPSYSESISIALDKKSKILPEKIKSKKKKAKQCTSRKCEALSSNPGIANK